MQLIDPEYDPLTQGDALLLKVLKDQLAKKEQQLSEMQSKMIGLYEQLSIKNAKKTACNTAGPVPMSNGNSKKKKGTRNHKG